MLQTIKLSSHKYQASQALKYMYIFTHVHTPYINSWVYIGLLRSRPTLTSRLNAVLHYVIKVDRRVYKYVSIAPI